MAGFLFIYPATASFTVGSLYSRIVAVPALIVHRVVYQPTIEYLGPESIYSKLWFSNAKCWCLQMHADVFCNVESLDEAGKVDE